MNKMKKIFLFSYISVLLFCCGNFVQGQNLEQRKNLFNNDWKFLLGDPANAGSVDLNDANWRQLDLPHDWSIEGQIAKDNPTGGSGGFVPAGIGWYRKTFKASKQWVGKKIMVEFEGIYMNADIWVNGNKIERYFAPYI